MVKLYKFISSSDSMPELHYEECRATGCRRGCGTNPIKAYLKKLRDRMEIHGITLRKDQFLPPKGFNEEGELNPFQIVADIYNEAFKDGLDECLNRKMNVTDCVYGCYSGIIDHEQPWYYPHQKRVYYFSPEVLPHMSTIISDKVKSQTFKSFEDIVIWLDELKKTEGEKSKGFGNLAIYDTALRLAWNSSRDKVERKKLLPEKVWLQQGAWEGANYLSHLRQLLKSPFKHPDNRLNHKMINDRDDFPEPIAKFEPYHIENIICIFHPLFKEWIKSL